MPKRTAVHRGRYKARPKPTAPMPALLLRALAQQGAPVTGHTKLDEKLRGQ